MLRADLLAVGSVYLDINCPSFPLGEAGVQPEREVVGNDYIVAPGGSALNFAKMCSSLGLTSKLIGKIGEDPMGSLLMDSLRDSEVEVDLIVGRSSKTNVSMNFVDESGRCAMAVVGDANQSLGPDEVYERVARSLPSCSYFYIGGCFKLTRLLPAFEELVILASRTDTRTVLDHGRLNSHVTAEQVASVQRLAQSVDYYLPSRREFLDLWAADSVEECLHKLGREVSGSIVVKDADRGAIAVANGEIVYVPAFPVLPVHTVGAGDGFNAGLIAASALSNELVESVHLACAAAALAISSEEPPTWQMVCDRARQDRKWVLERD